MIASLSITKIEQNLTNRKYNGNKNLPAVRRIFFATPIITDMCANQSRRKKPITVISSFYATFPITGGGIYFGKD